MTDVIFLKFCESTLWFGSWCPIGFSHVEIYKQIGTESYSSIGVIGLNPTDKALACKVIHGLGGIKKRENVLKITIDYTKLKKHKLSWWSCKWGFCTCVAITKYMLGLRGWSHTPRQLFKHLTSVSLTKRNPHILTVEVF